MGQLQQDGLAIVMAIYLIFNWRIMITAKEARQQVNAAMEKWVKKQYPKWFNNGLETIQDAVKHNKSSVILFAPDFVSDDLFHELMGKFRASPYNFHVSDSRNPFEYPQVKSFMVSW